jgi:AraC-like DNA-binding protein
MQWYAVQYGHVEMTLDGQTLLFGPGDSILIAPGVMRFPRSTANRKNAIGYFWVTFENHHLQLAASLGQQLPTPTHLQDDVLALVDELRMPGRHDANDLVYALVCRLLIGLARSAEDAPDPLPQGPLHAHEHARISQLEAFMSSNLHRPLTREDFGRTASLSPAHLARLYRQTTGKTLGTRLTELRLQRARQLLVSSSLSITQIALEIGFNSSSHFTRLFQRQVGVPPSTYRQAKGRIWLR